ncbi:MAG: TonB-dependent receptor, partial [Gammaproteobacteria bacterium]|nr:TonB-dependent receptor [Gammaproteobacteria bacterium]
DGADTAAGSIQLRSNSREYFSRGVQLGLDWQFTRGDAIHEIEVGIRYHEDEEDRLQRNSTYHQQNGRLVLDDLGLLGNAGNRVQEAEALAIYIQDTIELGNWVLTPGLRYEDIEQKRTRWETRDGRTTSPSSRADSNIRDTRSNDTQVWLPGFGVLYNLSEATTLVAGVHKGFTAPSNSPDVDEEDAINYELGFRYNGGRNSAEAIYFLSDYDNLLGECTASSGSDCTIGDAFNGDAATVQGIELLFTTDMSRTGNYNIPVTFTYTYIDSEFDSDVADTDFFGDVSKGDPIPYIPEHQFNLSVGFLKDQWSSYINVSFVDEVCVRASCNAFEKTDDSLTVDLSTHYALSEKIDLYGKVENITGEEDILGRHPYGARPNKYRTATLGVRIDF